MDAGPDRRKEMDQGTAPVDVSIGLFPGSERLISDAAGTRLEDIISSELQDMISDLGLPVRPRVSVSIDEHLPDGGVHVSVGGSPAGPVTLAPLLEPEATPPHAASILLRLVYSQRGLFVTDEVASLIVARWSGSTDRITPLPVEERRAHIQDLVRRGFAVDRMATAGSESGEGAGQIAHPESGGPSAGGIAADFDPEVHAFDPLPDWEPVSLSLVVSDGVWAAGAKTFEATDWDDAMALCQARVFEMRGTVIPPLGVERDPSLAGDTFRVRVNDLRSPRLSGLPKDHIWVQGPPAMLAELHRPSSPLLGVGGVALGRVLLNNAEILPWCQARGLSILAPGAFLLGEVMLTAATSASAFLANEVVNRYLEILRTTFPATVDAVIARFGRTKLALILRRVLDAQVSIRDLTKVLGMLLELRGSVPKPADRMLVFSPTARACPVEATGAEPSADDYARYIADYVREPVTA